MLPPVSLLYPNVSFSSPPPSPLPVWVRACRMPLSPTTGMSMSSVVGSSSNISSGLPIGSGGGSSGAMLSSTTSMPLTGGRLESVNNSLLHQQQQQQRLNQQLQQTNMAVQQQQQYSNDLLLQQQQQQAGAKPTGTITGMLADFSRALGKLFEFK